MRSVVVGVVLATAAGCGASTPRVQAGPTETRPAAEVVRGREALVTGTASGSELRSAADAADDAWRRCEAVWPESPVPAPVVLLPSDGRDARSLLESRTSVPTEPGHEQGRAAATTVVVGEPPVARAQVHLDPTAWRELSPEGERVVLTHECVHVALSARARPAAPRWLVEGVAEYVAYRETSIDVREVWAPLLRRVARQGVPRRLPVHRDFETAGRSTDALTQTYAEAATAAAVYADIHGEQALLALVTTGPPAHRGERASYASVERELLPQWQRRLAQRDLPYVSRR